MHSNFIFFNETVMSAAKNLFPSSVHLILLTRRQKKRDFRCSPLRLKIGVEVCWSIHFALVHPAITSPLLFSYLCVSSCWRHSAKLFLPLVLPEGSSHVPAYLHQCFPGILPALLFFAILILALDFLLFFFFLILKPPIFFYMKPQLQNFIAPICPSSGLHFQVFSF